MFEIMTIIFAECEAVKFWMLSRHGTRNPSAKSIEQMYKLLDVMNLKKN